MFDFLEKLKKDVGAVRSEVDKIDCELAAARKRKQELEELPIPKSDVIAILHAQIDGVAKGYPERLRKALAGVLRKPGRYVGPDAQHVNFLMTGAMGTRSSLPDVYSVMLADLIFFKDAEFKAGLTKAVKAMPDWSAGPPLAERTKELAHLGEQISKLEKGLASLKQSAAESGIRIDGGTQ